MSAFPKNKKTLFGGYQFYFGNNLCAILFMPYPNFIIAAREMNLV